METYLSSELNVTHLMAKHEEADTRLILHASDALKEGLECFVITSRNTDVMVMAVSILSNSSDDIWLRAGTTKIVEKTYQLTG